MSKKVLLITKELVLARNPLECRTTTLPVIWLCKLFLIIALFSGSPVAAAFTTPDYNPVNDSDRLEVLQVTNINAGLPTGSVLAKSIFSGSGDNFIVISDVGDNSPGVSQDITITAESADTSLLEVVDVSYDEANAIAIINVIEKGKTGDVEVTATITDSDGQIQSMATISIIPYVNPGVLYKIVDAVFWQEISDYETTGAYEEVLAEARAPEDIDFTSLELTVPASCGDPTLCKDWSFLTHQFIGYVVAPETGAYTFTIEGVNDKALWLSENTNFGSADVIASKSDNHGNIGTTVGQTVVSDPVNLVAGQVYAYYGIFWEVHTKSPSVKWSGPGLPAGDNYIGGEYSYAIYDTEKPSTPSGLELIARSATQAKIKWTGSTDNQGVEFYNIYVNGSLFEQVAAGENSLQVEGLTPSTKYSLFVTAQDKMGNESEISNIVSFETYPEDNIPPAAVTGLGTSSAAGLALLVSWNPAVDNETAIFGYNIYLDDVLQNTGSLIFDTVYILSVLEPETTYQVKVEAIDAGGNTSEATYEATTTVFDPLGENLGVITGQMLIDTTVISKTRGLGVNVNYSRGRVMDSLHTVLLGELKPAVIRWGAIDANNKSFDEYTGANAPNNGFTIGKFLERAAEFGANVSFTCGMNASTDWMTTDTKFDENTFLKFLEYVNGPDNTPGGQLRVEEGYTTPFLEKHDMLIFEFGNEVWGRSTHNSPIGDNYNTYAAECRRIAEIMKASPYYDSDKIKLVISTRYPSLSSSYGLNEKTIKGDNGSVDWTGPSGYLGGNLNYDPEIPASNSELEYYEKVYDRMEGYITGMTESHAYEIVNRGNGEYMKMYLYESNTTTPSYNGRLGQAILSTDYYQAAMERGAVAPTIFHLTGGQWTITAIEDNRRRLSLFRSAQLLNTYCKGDILKSNYVTGTSDGSASSIYDAVGTYAYKTEEGYRAVLMSRDFINDHYVEVNLPAGANLSGTATIYILSGEDFSTRYAQMDTTENITLKEKMLIKVPKHSMVLLKIDQTGLSVSDLDPGHFTFIEQNSINIVEVDSIYTEQAERKTFNVEIEPEDALVDGVKWELIGDGNDAFALSGSGASTKFVRLQDSTAYTGPVMLRATSFTDSTVYDEITLTYDPASTDITGRSVDNSTYFFPNPAGSSVFISSAEASLEVVIYNLAGKGVLSGTSKSGEMQLDVSGLRGGLYIISVNGEKSKLIIEN